MTKIIGGKEHEAPTQNERTEVQNPHRPYPYRQRRKQQLASYSSHFVFLKWPG